MHIAVLGAAQSWYVRDLQRAAGLQHQITPLPFSEMAAVLGGRQSPQFSSAGQSLRDCSAVLVRSMPPGTLEQVIFRMNLLAELESAGVCVINPPKALEAAIDKYLSLARLEAAGLLTPPTWVCQTAEHAMAGFETLGGDVVLKPIFGGEGRGLMRVSDPDLALRACKTLEQLGAVIYLQQFLPHHGHDLRLFVLGSQVLGMQRINPRDWRSNISRGATAVAIDVTPELADLALRAAAAVGAPLAGVDVLPALDGSQYVIEVNAVPGWKALSQVLSVDVAALVLSFLEEQTDRAARPAAGA